jgi:hypothetical protein
VTIVLLKSALATYLAQAKTNLSITVLDSDFRYDSKFSQKSDFKFPEIIRHLNQWDFGLMRLVGNLSHLDELKQLMSLQISNWLGVLKDRNCNLAVFESIGSHHAETICLEVTCDMLKVPKLFLAHSSFTYRLLPIMQQGEYSSRSLIREKVSTWKCDESRLDIGSEWWKHRTSPQSRLEKSWTFFLRQQIVKSVKRNLFLARKENAFAHFFSSNTKMNSNLDQIIERYLGPRFFDELKLAISHKKALRYLQGRLELHRPKLQSLFESTRSRIIIVYAHFQPEASSFPNAGVFASHVTLVAEIRNRFPESVIIYCEHPGISRLSRGVNASRVGLYRSTQYFRTLESLGCLFSSSEDINLISTSNSKITHLTIGGNIAIERALKGLCTVVVGSPWFSGIPGTMTFKKFMKIPEESFRIHNPQDAVNWILQSHDSTTISPGTWSNFVEGEDLEYFNDMETLLRKLYRKGFQS